jgi:hypothetical protein
VLPSTRYTREDIENALTKIRTGYDSSDDAKSIGFVSGLIQLSEERTEESTDPGEWLQNILRDADALVVDASGIYLEHGNRGIRIYRFPFV